MNIYDSNLWKKDIDLVLNGLFELETMSKQNILVTGASGLLGSAIVDVLIRYNESFNKSIKIFAAGRSESSMRDRFGIFFEKEYFHFIPYGFWTKNAHGSIIYDYIIHGAGPSAPSDIICKPVETMLANFVGANDLLDYARNNKTKRFLYVSSSEVYGSGLSSSPYKEDDRGSLDFLQLRNCYSVSKQATEALCNSYANEYGINCVIVRPGHVYGPNAKVDDGHIVNIWIRDVIKKNDIVMKSSGEQIRSYVYSLDCASAILKALIKGKSKSVYNISNPYSIISIKEMAQILCNLGGVNLVSGDANAQEKNAFNPMADSSLDSTLIQSLTWNAYFDAATGLEHTIKILKEVENKESLRQRRLT